MKNQIQTLLISFFVFCASAPMARAESEPLGVNVSHSVVFKKPIVIPFQTLTPVKDSTALQAMIEKSGHRDLGNLLAITIVEGEVIRATQMFSRLNEGNGADFDLVSKKRERNLPMGMSEEDVSYCVFYINASKLQRDEIRQQYVFMPKSELLPYTEPATTMKSININFGTVTEQSYGMFVELKPSERPNEFTIRGRSREIPMFDCFRYASKNRGLRAQDFVQILGSENIEFRTK